MVWIANLPRLGQHMTEPTFSHLDDTGRARMVDVAAKDPTARRAVARCVVKMQRATAAAIANGEAVLT